MITSGWNNNKIFKKNKKKQPPFNIVAISFGHVHSGKLCTKKWSIIFNFHSLLTVILYKGGAGEMPREMAGKIDKYLLRILRVTALK